MAFSLSPRHIIDEDPERKTFTAMNWHMSGYDRKLCAQGLSNFIPMMYRNKPSIYRDILDVDVAMITVSPMDKHGFFTFGSTVSATAEICKKAKKVILEVNEAAPRVLGGSDECIHIPMSTWSSKPVPFPCLSFLSKTATTRIRRLPKMILKEIPDGATLQLGVGGLPNAVGAMIADSDLKDLGMHTEMLVDAFLLMYKKRPSDQPL